MLKIKNITEPINEKIIIDQYIPVKILFGEWDVIKSPTNYWRTGDFNKSLVEIGVSSNSGVLRSITIVHFTECNIIVDQETRINFPQLKEGIPVFDISDFRKDYSRIDEIGLLEVEIFKNLLLIRLSKEPVKKIIKNNRTSFGIDIDNNLCLIQLNNLSQKELAHYRNVFGFVLRQ